MTETRRKKKPAVNPKKTTRATTGLHIAYRESLGKTIAQMTPEENREYQRLQKWAQRNRAGVVHRKGAPAERLKDRKGKKYVSYTVRIEESLKERVLNAEAALPDFDVTEMVEKAFSLYVGALERQHNGGEPFPQREKK